MRLYNMFRSMMGENNNTKNGGIFLSKMFTSTASKYVSLEPVFGSYFVLSVYIVNAIARREERNPFFNLMSMLSMKSSMLFLIQYARLMSNLTGLLLAPVAEIYWISFANSLFFLFIKFCYRFDLGSLLFLVTFSPLIFNLGMTTTFFYICFFLYSYICISESIYSAM